ncbi:MAG TPA: AmmeMemoRadiSam system protein B [Candidatus Binataceae bacterium]|nr:AmmeMemoRadiSam system protein B [Candidatus Binataceae bacterium]
MDTPRIRAVEAFPVEHEGQTMICLRDPMGFAPQPILLGMGGYFLITQFDGRRTLAEISEAYSRQFGEVLAAGKLEELIAALDQGFYLDSQNFARRRTAVHEEFNATSERAAVHAGLCYEGDARRLREELAAFFDPPHGPGRSAQRGERAAPAGLIAPHIDPRRGGPAYAHAYFQLMGCEPPELFVILGTSHYGAGPELFAATLKDYATPLGAVQTDRDFVRRLAARYSGGDLFADELLHRNEHSIEFQALFLAWALGTRGYQVVPILVSSFHEMVASGRVPAEDPRVSSFVEALRAELAAESRSVCIIAGVDFAHVGRKFGDQEPADEKFVQWVEGEDRALIENIVRGDPEGFFRAIDKDKDRRRICGLAPMYTQLEVLRGRRGRLLKYDVALEPPTQSAVSFASLAIE